MKNTKHKNWPSFIKPVIVTSWTAATLSVTLPVILAYAQDVSVSAPCTPIIAEYYDGSITASAPDFSKVGGCISSLREAAFVVGNALAANSVAGLDGFHDDQGFVKTGAAKTFGEAWQLITDLADPAIFRLCGPPESREQDGQTLWEKVQKMLTRRQDKTGGVCTDHAARPPMPPIDPTQFRH